MHLVPNVRAFVHSMPTLIGGDVVLRTHGLGLSHATGIASRNTGVLSNETLVKARPLCNEAACVTIEVPATASSAPPAYEPMVAARTWARRGTNANVRQERRVASKGRGRLPLAACGRIYFGGELVDTPVALNEMAVGFSPSGVGQSNGALQSELHLGCLCLLSGRMF